MIYSNIEWYYGINDQQKIRHYIFATNPAMNKIPRIIPDSKGNFNFKIVYYEISIIITR